VPFYSSALSPFSPSLSTFFLIVLSSLPSSSHFCFSPSTFSYLSLSFRSRISLTFLLCVFLFYTFIPLTTPSTFFLDLPPPPHTHTKYRTLLSTPASTNHNPPNLTFIWSPPSDSSLVRIPRNGCGPPPNLARNWGRLHNAGIWIPRPRSSPA
jgi:hypothetical protein